MPDVSSLLQRAEEAAKEGMRMAAEWLAVEMRLLVGFQGDDQNRSSPGEPPYRQTGAGQASIWWEPTADGARVGTKPIGTDGVIGENYMAGWDAGTIGPARPWLSTWQRYKPEIDRIVRREIIMQTGMRG